MSSSSTRAAVVTGAAQGIGRAIALQLAQDGFEVALNDLPSNSVAIDSLTQEIKRKGRKTIAVLGDVSQATVVQDLVDQTVSELGDLHVMVANAGVFTSIGAKLVDVPLEAWERLLSINMTGVFLCYKYAARQMIKQGKGGRIIGASSIYGKRGAYYKLLAISQGHGGASVYSASKFGVRGLTQALATELGEYGITVNAYAPGYIDTPMLSDAVSNELSGIPGEGSGGTDSEVDLRTKIEAIGKATPLQRLGTAEDIARLVSYIASDGAAFMTGQSVSINGGVFYD
ncbi:NAD-binding protein [Ramaria rubella]|nr:NAD-binding protein [Ramaria rubella]